MGAGAEKLATPDIARGRGRCELQRQHAQRCTFLGLERMHGMLVKCDSMVSSRRQESIVKYY